jgi:hypothetical protein
MFFFGIFVPGEIHDLTVNYHSLIWFYNEIKHKHAYVICSIETDNNLKRDKRKEMKYRD